METPQVFSLTSVAVVHNPLTLVLYQIDIIQSFVLEE